MRTRTRIAATTATALALAGLAGCGGSSDTVTQTVTTDEVPTTAPTTAATTSATPATSGSTAAAPAAIGEDRLPPPGVIDGTETGTSRPLDDAQEFVDALYQVGDPSKPAAQARLESAGYSGGILRDELGSDPASGIALFRTYAIGVRDEAAAQTEVDDAADEVDTASTAPSREVDVSGIPGARALRLDIDQAGTTGSVVFVTFAAGPYVYGLQGVSTGADRLPQDAIVAAAQEHYAQVSATP
jgi:hypothetical protein